MKLRTAFRQCSLSVFLFVLKKRSRCSLLGDAPRSSLIFALAFQESDILIDLIYLILAQVLGIFDSRSNGTAGAFGSRFINVSCRGHQFLIGNAEGRGDRSKHLRRCLFPQAILYSFYFCMADIGKFSKPPDRQPFFCSFSLI